MRWPRVRRDPVKVAGSQAGLLLVLVIVGGVVVAAPEPDPDFGDLFWPGLLCLIAGVAGLTRMFIKWRER
jgi:hypothetical protein